MIRRDKKCSYESSAYYIKMLSVCQGFSHSVLPSLFPCVAFVHCLSVYAEELFFEKTREKIFFKKVLKRGENRLQFAVRYGILFKLTRKRKHSSAGRASALQAEGHRFEPCCFHQHSAESKIMRE